jgi:O-antigen ligase
LVHNDYLEQATDSGIVGFLLYAVFVGGVLWRARPAGIGDRLHFAIWLGVLGWGLQSLMEFGLYIPALAWPAFTFLGLLVHRISPKLKSVDKMEAAALPSAR